jgi:predicted lipoprotein with Yx(FWY)xxD motif
VRSWLVTKGLRVDHRAEAPAERAAERPGGALGGSGSRSASERLGVLRRPLVALVALAAAGALAAACGGNNSGSGGSGGYGGATPTSAPSGVATVAATSSKLGSILVDGSGRTLYLFEKDKADQSACVGACVAAWPVDKSSAAPKTGSGVQASLLGTVKRSDGSTQVTYNHHPLYYYSGDSAAGQQNGQGVNAFGALWYVVAPTGGAVTGGATATTTANGGYGG